MHSPRKSHLDVALRLLKYLKTSPGKGIKISKCNSNVVTGFVDVDWAKCLPTRKFVTGYCVFFRESLISWRSKNRTLFPDHQQNLNTGVWGQ